MTYTIVASDPERGLLGVATASFSLAVGAGVPALRVGVGAVASQAYTNRALREHALAALAAGESPAEIVAGIPGIDSGHARRQLAVVSAAGQAAAHTGVECSDWAGHRVGAGYAVAGNLLTGPAVLDEMIAAYERSRDREPEPGVGALARGLLAAIAAGEAAGGDRRGRQSVALLVGHGRRGPGENVLDLDLDLRVDDHPEPVRELGRILDTALTP